MLAPANWMNGTAESSPMTMQAPIGVCRRGLTFDIQPEIGNWLSRAIPKHSRMVEVRIDMQHTKIAAVTTSR